MTTGDAINGLLSFFGGVASSSSRHEVSDTDTELTFWFTSLF